jgi:hypothetical protein
LASRSPLRLTFGSIVRFVFAFFIGRIVCVINTHSSLKIKVNDQKKCVANAPCVRSKGVCLVVHSTV